ncbi:MAG: pyridoxine/pyridoxamine 5'-phosphate oxidase, partial [Flavobacteriaceae bacterium]
MENPFKNAPSFIKFILETFKETGKNKQHWLKKGVLATTQASGAPCLRTVVIRAVNELLYLEIHTDSRSKKVVDILSNSLAEILFYDPISEIQLKFSGPVKLLQTGLEVNEAWKKIP